MARDIGAVQACAFDMFGTLFDVHSVVAACRDAFGSEGEAFSRFWRQKQLEYTWLRALMGRWVPFRQVTADALDTALRHYGRAGEAALGDRLMAAYNRISPYPEAGAALERLAATGVGRVILTNGSRELVQAALATAGFADKFDQVFSVDDVATYKPNPLVYEMAHVRLGLDKRAILMVSSHPWDLAGAISYGFQGVWVDRPGSGGYLERLGYDPDYRVVGLDGLADLIEGERS